MTLYSTIEVPEVTLELDPNPVIQNKSSAYALISYFDKVLRIADCPLIARTQNSHTSKSKYRGMV